MWWLMFLLEFSLIAAAVILIILVMLQKGKGGGLAGTLAAREPDRARSAPRPVTSSRKSRWLWRAFGSCYASSLPWPRRIWPAAIN